MGVPDVIAITVFLGIFLLCLLAYLGARIILVGNTDRVSARLSEGARQGGTSLHEVRSKLVFGALTEPLSAQIPQFKAEAKALELELRRAGYYKPSARIEYLAIRNSVIVLILLLAAGAIAAIGPDHSLAVGIIIISTVILSVVAYGVPRLVITVIGDKRVREIQKGLPDALDMIAMSVSGGLPLQDALDAVSFEIRSTHKALAFELDLVRQQTEMGALDQALRQFAHRIDAPEVRQMAALVTQSDRLGTNVVRSLQDHADNIRRLRRARADEQTSKAGIKMLFPLVLCMAPSVFILLWGPALLEMRSFYETERRAGGALSQPIDFDFGPPRQNNDQFDSIMSAP